MAGVRMLLRGRVEALLEVGDEAVVGLLVGVRLAGGRHHAAAELARHLLPDLGMRADVPQIRVLERQARLLAGGVVAIEAIVLNDGGELLGLLIARMAAARA